MKICRKKQVLGFDDTWLLILGIPIVSLIIPLMFVQYAGADAHEPDWYQTSVTITFIHACIYIFVFHNIECKLHQ